jgi:nitroimidazol reductase NimA-like FMN-containing flavoprotein (pyridoxamine 5'-phosphate oxidase superfamily)
MSATDKQYMEQLLCEGDVGYLAFASAEPYVIPINYAYCNGRILFHCALEGKKLDLIRADPRVCFAVARQEGHPAPHAGDACDNPFESVLCWGDARIIDDLQERQAILNEFQTRFDTPERKRDPVSLERTEKCGAVEIVVTRMTGRKVSGKEKLCWSWQP